MQKIYGYKNQDVIGLAKFLQENKNQNLTAVFTAYSIKTGKAQGTVRNMYYALVKYSAIDKEFTEKYLGGTPLSASKIVEFDEGEEEKLAYQILTYKKQGYSVRSAISKLTAGDEKLALRYQNKYRNLIKKKPEMIEKISKKVGVECALGGKTTTVSESQYLKLKQEIDGLVNRISLKIRRENQLLKDRIEMLELENLRLNNLLVSSENAKNALSFLKTGKNKNVLN